MPRPPLPKLPPLPLGEPVAPLAKPPAAAPEPPAEREGYSANTLRWWSSRLGRDTRAVHGAPVVTPIEIAVSDGVTRGGPSVFEVAVGDALVRCDMGTHVRYVVELVRTIRGR